MHAFVDRVVGHVLVVVVETFEVGHRPGAQPRQQLVADLGDDCGLVQVDDNPTAVTKCSDGLTSTTSGGRGVT